MKKPITRPRVRILVALLFSVVAVPASASGQRADVAATTACGDAARAIQKVADGAGDAISLEFDLRRAYDRAQRSNDADLRRTLGAAVSAARSKDSDQIIPALRNIVGHCTGVLSGGSVTVYAPSPIPTPTAPIPAPSAGTSSGGGFGGLAGAAEKAGQSIGRMTERLREATRAMRELRSLQGGPLPPPSAPVPSSGPASATTTNQQRAISEQDADRHIRGVLERSGAGDAKCEKKQYGTGWVTVCE